VQSKNRFLQMAVASKVERVSAAVVALAITSSIVWAISGYAYPGSPSSWLGQVAIKAPLQSGS
jgi:hypothetical protein